MASRKLEQLSEEDLSYVEKLLGKEFAKAADTARSFETKHHYKPYDETKRISRIMDAIRSEKQFKKTTSIKW